MFQFKFKLFLSFFFSTIALLIQLWKINDFIRQFGCTYADRSDNKETLTTPLLLHFVLGAAGVTFQLWLSSSSPFAAFPAPSDDHWSYTIAKGPPVVRHPCCTRCSVLRHFGDLCTLVLETSRRHLKTTPASIPL